jgi:hypothetical protein
MSWQGQLQAFDASTPVVDATCTCQPPTTAALEHRDAGIAAAEDGGQRRAAAGLVGGAEDEVEDVSLGVVYACAQQRPSGGGELRDALVDLGEEGRGVVDDDRRCRGGRALRGGHGAEPRAREKGRARIVGAAFRQRVQAPPPTVASTASSTTDGFCQSGHPSATTTSPGRGLPARADRVTSTDPAGETR